MAQEFWILEQVWIPVVSGDGGGGLDADRAAVTLAQSPVPQTQLQRS